MNYFNKNLIITAFAAVFLLAGCSSSNTSSSSEGTRQVTGVIGGETSALSAIHAAGCGADRVIATDTEGNTTVAEVCSGDAGDEAFPECSNANACSFTLTLGEETAYIISFLLDDEFVATLSFDSGITGFSTGVLPLSDCELETDELNLGTITFSGSLAIPENEPLEQTDDDCDGIPDLEDNDDDGDGIPDDEEEDCDLDGFSDDLDEDDDDCDDGEGGVNDGKVLTVKPRNDPQPDRGNDCVDTDQDVKVRIRCAIDPSTVTAETFDISSDSHTVSCEELEIDVEKDDDTPTSEIECEHEEDPFELDTVYTGTIDGILCTDGTPVETVSWSWCTEENEDDKGKKEDELDECDDLCELICEVECGDDDDCEDECEKDCKEDCNVEVAEEFSASILAAAEEALNAAQEAIDDAPAEADVSSAQDKIDAGLEKLAEAEELHEEGKYKDAVDKAEDAAELALDALEALEDAVEDLEEDGD